MWIEGPMYPLRYPEDISYCANRYCPIKDCGRHLDNLKSCDTPCIISIADFSGICKQYIAYLVHANEDSGT